ncbi:MAG: NAD-binding protein [Deltaproteobacteria bacterium]|nr:NAD-binding protein [Deltaproteobacteria bacterium]
MRRSSRRLIALLLSIPVLLFALAMLYSLGMTHLEGDPRSLGDSVEWVSETLTSTGYGRDNHWDHPLMIAFVIVVQFAGVLILFMVFPIFLIPFFEERFESRLPTQLPDLDGQVLIYNYGPAVATLVELLAHDKIPFVVIEENQTRARRLHDRDLVVVTAQLETEEVALPGVDKARAIVANGPDHNNAVLTLSARQNKFEGPIVALVANPHRRNPMVRAGATAAFTPLHVLAAAIAAKASAKLNPRVSGAQPLGRKLEIVEMRIPNDSELAGKTLAEADLRNRTGVSVIGMWRDGELHAKLDPFAPLAAGTILVCAGSRDAIDKFAELVHPIIRDGPLVIIGDGELAHKAKEMLVAVGEDVTLLSAEPHAEADEVGDMLDPGVLKRVGVKDAQAIILALENDSTTLFCSAIIRDLSKEAPIIASVERSSNVGRIRRAGADFALSVAQIAGQLLAFHVLGEESVELERQLRLVKIHPGSLEGDNPVELRVGERTGCTVVAVERSDSVITDFGQDFAFEANDTAYLSGSPDGIVRFFEEFPGARHLGAPS